MARLFPASLVFVNSASPFRCKQHLLEQPCAHPTNTRRTIHPSSINNTIVGNPVASMSTPAFHVFSVREQSHRGNIVGLEVVSLQTPGNEPIGRTTLCRQWRRLFRHFQLTGSAGNISVIRSSSIAFGELSFSSDIAAVEAVTNSAPRLTSQDFRKKRSESSMGAALAHANGGHRGVRVRARVVTVLQSSSPYCGSDSRRRQPPRLPSTITNNCTSAAKVCGHQRRR